MTKIIVYLATGFEEMEAIVPIDVWRRANFDVVTVSISDQLAVKGAHNITIMADQLFDTTLTNDADMIYLPGGMPGASNLDAHEGLKEQLVEFSNKGKTLGALCAAPLVLGHNQLLNGIKTTCYPGFEKELYNAKPTGIPVQADGNIVTGRGAGIALEYALHIVARFTNKGNAEELAQQMQVADHFIFV